MGVVLWLGIVYCMQIILGKHRGRRDTGQFAHRGDRNQSWEEVESDRVSDVFQGHSWN